MPLKRSRGVSLIEVILTVAIAAVLMTVSVLNLSGFRRRTDLNNATRTIGGMMREAQNRSISQSSSTLWGVYFENSTTTPAFFALFLSGTYSATTTVNRIPLPSGVAYVTSSLAVGASRTVTFEQVTGLPSASTSISIYVIGNPAASSTIAVASSGAITY